MNIKKIQLLTLLFVAVLTTNAWGQTNSTSVVLLDNYDGVGDLTYNKNTSVQWSIGSGTYNVVTNGVSTPEHSNTSYDLTNSISGWNLSKTKQNVWIGWFQQVTNATSGYGSSNYGIGMVLAANGSDFSSTSVQGYALVVENVGSNDKVTLVKFSQGITDGSTNLPSNSTAIVSVAVDPGTTGFNFLVELLDNGKWKISYKTGSQLSDVDAIDKTKYNGGTATSASSDETYTGASYKYAGWVWAHSTSGSAKAKFDNFGAAQAASGSTPPTLTTTSLSSITTTAASGGGNVTADGGATVTERGIVYKTSTNPTTSDSKVTDGGTGTGSYTSSLTSLATNTKYYVRAYAINSEGTAYGSNEIFTTLSNAPAMDDVTARNPSYASFTANWTAPTNDGAEAYTYTLEVSTNAGDFSSPVVTQANISATNYNVTGLNASTNYYYRVKAVNAGGSSAFSSVSTVVTTLTAVAPTVTTTSLSSITTTSASGGGNVTADGGATVTERGIVYSTSVNPTTADTKVTSGTGTGSYTANPTGLTANTTYHVRAYAINSVNTSYGSNESFVTLANEPTTISTVSFGTVTNNSLVVNFTGGNGAKRIVLMRKSSAVNIGSAPVDGTTYTASATFGSGDVIPTEANVVYVGSGTTVTVTNLDKNATYHVAVYEFNENIEGAPNYLTTDRATGNKTTYNPNISVSSITAFGNQVINTISASKSYPVIGSQLASNITVTAPADFQISTDDVDFSVNPITLIKNGNDSVIATIYVRYAPATATGSTGAVNITNTATDATTRNVGISGNAIDEEPTVESSISFGNISSGSMVLNFAGGDAYKRLVLVKEGSAVNAAPTDGTNYTANTAFKSGSQIGTGNYVVFNGTTNTVTVTNLKANTTYHVAVFGFNEGTGTSQNYLAAVTGINNATTKAVIAGWDFTGKDNVATSQATTFNTNIETASNADYITRGAGAAASAGSNSFRTTGFQNDGIATTNTDYFQITLQAKTGYVLSLSNIDANFNGSTSYAASPGVSNQFAYSFDGTNFTLIGSPTTTTGAPVAMAPIDLTGIGALQNVPHGTTITLRYYASGQTTTGGWGFHSISSGTNGLAIGGAVTLPVACVAPTTQASAISFSNITSTSMKVGWANGNGGNRIVKMNTSNSFTAPIDGEDTTANTVYSGAGEQVVYNGNNNNVTVTGLSLGNTYYYRVYEYNCIGDSTKYNISTASNNPNNATTSASSNLIAGWDFQTTSNGGTAVQAKPNTPKVINANVGAGTIYLDGTNYSSNWTTADNETTNQLNAFTGTTVNATSGSGLSTDSSGTTSLALMNQSANNQYVIFKFSMTSFKNLVVSYAARRTGSGFDTHVWEYSTNGSTWNSVNTINTIPTSFNTVFTLDTITGLNNAANAYLRLTVSGASANNSNNRLDNIQFNATGNNLTVASDYFRSKSSGSWLSTSTWESSADNITYINATLAPTEAATAINVKNTHTVTIPSNGSATATTLATEAGSTLSMGSSSTLTVKGTWTHNATATFNAGTGTVVFNGSSAQNIVKATFHNLTINNSSSATLTDDIDVNATLDLQTDLTIDENILVLNGNVTGSGKLIGSALSALSFTGTASPTINFKAGNRELFWLDVNKPSGTVTLGSDVAIDDELSLSSTSTLNDGGYTITLSGNITGTGTHIGSGKIIMNTSGKTIDGVTLGNVDLNEHTTLTGNATFSGLLSLASSKILTIGSNTLTLSGTISGDGVLKGSASSNINIGGSGGTLGSLLLDQTTDGTSNVLNNFTYNRTSGGTLSLGNKLVVMNAVTPSNGQFITNNYLHIRSTASNTARIGDATGNTFSNNYITGNVTVERYISASSNRAYRMLTPSVTTTNYIRDNWQEGTNNPDKVTNNNPNAGYGTHITGAGGSSNGFDVTQTNQSSLFQLISGAWVAVGNTNATKLYADQAYLLFVRGSRDNINTINTASGSSNTTLRATGTLKQGAQSFTNLPAEEFSLVSNPFAAPLNWGSLYTANSSNFENYITIWDPNVGTRGGYVTVNNTGTNNNGGSHLNAHIQSGQAFFVTTKSGGTKTLNITEADKSTTNNLDVYKDNNTSEERLNILLRFKESATNKDILADGVLARFDASYSNEVISAEDAEQIINWDEDIALQRGGKSLSIESRKLITTKDTLFLQIANLKAAQSSYRWVMAPQNFATDGNLVAFLEDAYTGSRKAVSLTDSTTINFTVNNNAASTAANRFRIVFTERTLYYSKATNIEASDVNSWSSTPDGTGNSPANFDEVANFIVQQNHKLQATNNIHLTQGSLTLQPYAGINHTATISLTGNIENNGSLTGTGVVILNASIPQYISGTGSISNLKLDNTTGAVIKEESKLYISSSYTPTAGILTTNNNLVLQSTETQTASINKGNAAGNYLKGAVRIERYIPAKASRKWSFITSPITQSIATGWQQQIHITGAGTGGSNCPSLQAHSNGYDATPTNAASIFTYDASKLSGQRWQAPASTLSDYTTAGKAFRVNIRGDRNLGCSLLDGTNNIPSAVTLYTIGNINIENNNAGNFSISYPNVGTDNYIFIGNPYPSGISFSALQTANSSNIHNNYAVYIPSNAAGVYTYWDALSNSFTGGTGYDNATGDKIVSGQALFVQSKTAGNVNLSFTEDMKVEVNSMGYFRNNNNISEKIKISYLQSNDTKIDETVIRYLQDEKISNTQKGMYDIPSMNSGTYISSLKGTTFTAVQSRSLQSLSHDEVWLNIGASQSGSYQLSFSDYEDFTAANIYLIDHLTNTTQNIKENATYMFSVDANNAASKGATRFSIVFNRTASNEVVYNQIKMYPNPADKQVSLLLPQGIDNGVNYQIKLTDITGKIVMQRQATGGKEVIDIAALTAGIYIVEITDSKGKRVTEKLVKN